MSSMAGVPQRGPDGSVRVAVSGLISGENWSNIFWCNLTGGNSATQADLDSWTNAFYSAYATNICPLIVTSVSATNCVATLFQNTTQALHTVVSANHPGTNADALMLEISASQVISWTHSQYYKGGKPRTYVPGIGTTFTTDGKTLTAARVTAIAAAGNSFHTAVNALSSGTITQTQHGFCRFMSGGNPFPVGQFFPINGAKAHPRIGSQRGRLG